MLNIQNYPAADHLIHWIKMREVARVHGVCEDNNINKYRYCNVRREDDKVTKHIGQWLLPHVGDALFAPNVLMARLFNNPETLDTIGYLEKFDRRHVKRVTDDLKSRGIRVFNPAYIVSTNGRKMDKVDYLLEHVLIHAFAKPFSMTNVELETMWRMLMKFNGVGSFMAAQVVADMKMFPPWSEAVDYWTFVAPGPGSQRGMNRLRGLPAKGTHYNQKSFSMYIQPVRAIIEARTGIKLCAQNTQNCLCEFDKYMRLVSGEGTPKQQYKR